MRRNGRDDTPVEVLGVALVCLAGQRDIRHPQMRMTGGDVRDECLGHRRIPRGSLSRQSWQRAS
jgi:hypothetical protein